MPVNEQALEPQGAPHKSDSRNTWNDSARIARHRALSPEERLRLTIEASRAALRFATGPRRS